MHRIDSLWTTVQEQARLDAELEAKMRKLEQDGEDLNQIQALIAAKKEARQCCRNSSELTNSTEQHAAPTLGAGAQAAPRVWQGSLSVVVVAAPLATTTRV